MHQANRLLRPSVTCMRFCEVKPQPCSEHDTNVLSEPLPCTAHCSPSCDKKAENKQTAVQQSGSPAVLHSTNAAAGRYSSKTAHDQPHARRVQDMEASTANAHATANTDACSHCHV